MQPTIHKSTLKAVVTERRFAIIKWKIQYVYPPIISKANSLNTKYRYIANASTLAPQAFLKNLNANKKSRLRSAGIRTNGYFFYLVFQCPVGWYLPGHPSILLTNTNIFQSSWVFDLIPSPFMEKGKG